MVGNTRFDDGALLLAETTTVNMAAVVASVLPALFASAALDAQMSDDFAATGTPAELVQMTHQRLCSVPVYAVLTAIRLVLTGIVDVFEIISYASGAVEMYHPLQPRIDA